MTRNSRLFAFLMVGLIVFTSIAPVAFFQSDSQNNSSFTLYLNVRSSSAASCPNNLANQADLGTLDSVALGGVSSNVTSGPAWYTFCSSLPISPGGALDLTSVSITFYLCCGTNTSNYHLQSKLVNSSNSNVLASVGNQDVLINSSSCTRAVAVTQNLQPNGGQVKLSPGDNLAVIFQLGGPAAPAAICTGSSTPSQVVISGSLESTTTTTSSSTTTTSSSSSSTTTSTTTTTSSSSSSSSSSTTTTTSSNQTSKHTKDSSSTSTTSSTTSDSTTSDLTSDSTSSTLSLTTTTTTPENTSSSNNATFTSNTILPISSSNSSETASNSSTASTTTDAPTFPSDSLNSPSPLGGQTQGTSPNTMLFAVIAVVVTVVASVITTFAGRKRLKEVPESESL